MTTADLLSDLTVRGVELLANGDKLRIQPRDRVTNEEVEIIRQQKAVILKLLRSEGRAAAPIVPGHEHFNLWVDANARHWPEFIPGYHYDLRQPSRLRGIFTPRLDQDK